MNIFLIFILLSQAGNSVAYSSAHTAILNFNKPILSVTGSGIKTTTVKAKEYKILLYADVFAEDQSTAQDAAEAMRKAIIEKTKALGVKENDVVLTNVNKLNPIENDPYYRIEQDIQIWFKNVNDISRLKEQFLLIKGVQIGSITPIISGVSDYSPAIVKARKEAIKNARKEAYDLAAEIGVNLGELIYVTENIIYPTYTGYESAEESKITVNVTLFFEMIEHK